MPAVAQVRGFERKDGRPKRRGISIPRPGKPARRVFFSTRAERDRELMVLKRVAAIFMSPRSNRWKRRESDGGSKEESVCEEG